MWIKLSVQFNCSVMSNSVTPWTAACQASLSITSARSSRKFMSIESLMASNHLILHRPLLLLPSVFPSIRVFSNESALHIGWPEYWSFSFNHLSFQYWGTRHWECGVSATGPPGTSLFSFFASSSPRPAAPRHAHDSCPLSPASPADHTCTARYH